MLTDFQIITRFNISKSFHRKIWSPKIGFSIISRKFEERICGKDRLLGLNKSPSTSRSNRVIHFPSKIFPFREPRTHIFRKCDDIILDSQKEEITIQSAI